MPYVLTRVLKPRRANWEARKATARPKIAKDPDNLTIQDQHQAVVRSARTPASLLIRRELRYRRLITLRAIAICNLLFGRLWEPAVSDRGNRIELIGFYTSSIGTQMGKSCEKRNPWCIDRVV